MAIAARNAYLISSPSTGVLAKPSSSTMALVGGWKPAKKISRLRMAAENSNSSLAASSSSSSQQGIRINGGVLDSENGWWQEAFARLDAGSGGSLLQLLHEGARAFQVAMERNESLIKGSWLTKKWSGFGFDTKAWMKLLSYQVSVYALLQATMEIAMRGEGRDRDVHVFVQRSLSHQCGPLEDSIRKLLSSRDPSTASDWLWQQQLPFLVASFVNILEKNPEFLAVTSTAACPCQASDVTLLRLAISSCGAAMKLGPATVSCAAFTTTLTEEIGRLMNMQSEFLPIAEVYHFSCNLGLRREFLSYFGSRAASSHYNDASERTFWVDLSEQLLGNTLVREGVLTKLRPYDTTEALERDLATFGFFAALGRRSRGFLTGKAESQLDEPLASLLRYLEGGCVLFYPQLSTLTYYQLFIEVVCEEMEWLPIFPEVSLLGDSSHHSKNIAVYTVLNVCSRWVSDFLKYSTWVQDPAASRVVDFLLKCQSRLIECRERYNLSWDSSRECVVEEDGRGLLTPSDAATTQRQLQLFDEDMQNMEEAVCKLESLLESSPSGGSRNEKIETLRRDLERLRRLKKEAEALVSSKAKADDEICSDPGSSNTDLSDSGKTYNEVFYESIEKLRDASTDLWRGTQLLSTDVVQATVLLKNGALGQQLTEREKKMLKRTFTDLASVIPIGLLMLLPVTAVGHAAMLAAIQKYVPALIPSAYAPERLDLLRQLERVKEMEAQSQSEKKTDSNKDKRG